MIPRRASFSEPSKYWLGVASELVAPVLRAVAAMRSGRECTPPGAWRRGLIVSHNHIGDLLYRTPSLPALRAALPDCEWHYLAAPGAAEVLEGNPHLAAVLPLGRGDASWRLEQRGFAALRAMRFDVALCTNNRAHYPDFALAAALGVPNRVGFTYKGLSGLINHPVPIDYPSPIPAYFRAMVAAVGGVAPTWDLRPQLFPTSADRAEAVGAWDELALGTAAPVVAAVLTTRQREHVWPAEHYLGALRLVRERTGASVVLCGAASDSALLHAVARAAPFPCGVLAGRLSLRAFGEFLRRCSALLSTDSGPRHIANAVGTPVVFIRNLWTSSVEAGSYCDTDIDATPDHELVPIPRQLEILRAITPERVAGLVLRAMAPTGNAPGAGAARAAERPLAHGGVGER